MAKYSDEQIKQIIVTNPNKDLVRHGHELAEKLTRHVDGIVDY